MREVIQRLLEAEAEAKSMLAAAAEEAERIGRDAQKQAREHLARTAAQAKTEGERLVGEAVKAAEREREEALSRAAARIEARLCLDGSALRQAAEAVVRCVTRPE